MFAIAFVSMCAFGLGALFSFLATISLVLDNEAGFAVSTTLLTLLLVMLTVGQFLLLGVL